MAEVLVCRGEFGQVVGAGVAGGERDGFDHAPGLVGVGVGREGVVEVDVDERLGDFAFEEFGRGFAGELD